jgi:hypothetical protein
MGVERKREKENYFPFALRCKYHQQQSVDQRVRILKRFHHNVTENEEKKTNSSVHSNATAAVGGLFLA